MRTLFFDCSMGAAGDMLTAALMELTDDPEETVEEMNAFGIPEVRYILSRESKQGVMGTHMTVTVGGKVELCPDYEDGDTAPQETAHLHLEEGHHGHDHGDHGHMHHHDHDHEHSHGDHHHHDHGTHSHHSMKDVAGIIGGLNISEKVKADALAVYRLIAEAESDVHGAPVSEIHFHEVGTMDAVADVTAVCYLMEKLAPETVIASPVHTGSGHVHCAHGILPVPTPATEYLLRGIPVYSTSIKGELCTPTGAALLKYFVKQFAPMPVMAVEKTGYGLGTKEFPVANMLRAMIGETAAPGDPGIYELSSNIDDMTGEELGFAMDRLFEAGALDVYMVPVIMKKNRPGTLLRAMVNADKKEDVLKAFFRHTTTLGVREQVMKRYVMDRETVREKTPVGEFRKKKAEGFGTVREKWEFDDLADAAVKEGVSLREIKEELQP